MLLTQGALTIRNAETADAPTLCGWWNDGAVMEHAGFPHGLGTTAEKIAASLATDSDDTRRRLMVELGSVPVGEMCTENLGGGVAEIDIKICRADLQERGHGTKLLRLLISDLFARGYGKIVLDTAPENARARHVYEKIGFVQTRIDKDSWTDQLGRKRSSVHYELTPADFEKKL